MKKALLIAATLALAAPASAFTGNDLLDLCGPSAETPNGQDLCLVYVSATRGALEQTTFRIGVAMATILEIKKTDRPDMSLNDIIEELRGFCIQRSEHDERVLEVLIGHILMNEHTRGQNAAELYETAMQNAFPCNR